LEYGLKDHKEIFRKAENIFGGLELPLEAPKHTKQYQSAQSTQKPLKDYTAYFKRVQPQLRQTDYLLKRGISYETAERHAVGFDPNFTFRENGTRIPSIILFTGRNTYTARSTLPDSKDGERIKKVGRPSPLYLGGMLSKADRPLIITEGEIDALSVIEVGGSAMALGSTNNVPLFLKRVSKERPRVTLILSLDNDKAGQAATESIAKGLTSMNVDFKVCNISGDYNDPSEALQFNRDVFTKTVKGIY
jgi:replicative DNA helicase